MMAKTTVPCTIPLPYSAQNHIADILHYPKQALREHTFLTFSAAIFINSSQTLSALMHVALQTVIKSCETASVAPTRYTCFFPKVLRVGHHRQDTNAPYTK
jgi:hypothetical protein